MNFESLVGHINQVQNVLQAQAAHAKLQVPKNQSNEIWQSAITKLEEWSTPADWLFNKLNYTSLAYLTSIEEPLKRAFYEQETIRGCWTVRGFIETIWIISALTTKDTIKQ